MWRCFPRKTFCEEGGEIKRVTQNIAYCIAIFWFQLLIFPTPINFSPQNFFYILFILDYICPYLPFFYFYFSLLISICPSSTVSFLMKILTPFKLSETVLSTVYKVVPSLGCWNFYCGYWTSMSRYVRTVPTMEHSVDLSTVKKSMAVSGPSSSILERRMMRPPQW